jgi:hypothetical protein
MHRCNVCQGKIGFLASAKVLSKYDVDYFKCEACGFIQTESPFWLDEAYSKVINRSDVGLVARNIQLSGVTRSLISTSFNPDGEFLDYGGGYGLFVRLMRDAGYKFQYYDKYSQENHFAHGLETLLDDNSEFELVTAFEVMEHLVDPVGEIAKMLALSKNLMFTTQVIPLPVPKPEGWWYYGLDHGQHISFYTLKSLSKLAENFSLNFYSNQSDVHLFTEKRISPAYFKFVTSKLGTRFVNMFHKRKSLIGTDYQNSIDCNRY